MTSSKVLLLTESEQGEAWELIEEWGYPHPKEAYPSVVMVEVGSPPKAYVWFEYISEDQLLIHMAAKPEHRGTWLTRKMISKLHTVFELLGAKRVYVVTSDEYVNTLAERQSFINDDLGWYWEV